MKKLYDIRNVSIEGNIGSGKSSFMNYLKNIPNVQTYLEPIDYWTNMHGHNLLDLYYEDSAKWGFVFQMIVQKSLMEIMYKPTDKPYKIIERSIYSAKYTFVENLIKKGILNEVEFLVYSEWFDFCTKVLPLNIDLIVYIQCDPEICNQRVQKRGRAEEAGVNMDLIKELHELHENWLINNAFKDFNIPVYVIDGNQSLAQMKNNAMDLLQYIDQDHKFLRFPLQPLCQ